MSSYWYLGFGYVQNIETRAGVGKRQCYFFSVHWIVHGGDPER